MMMSDWQKDRSINPKGASSKNEALAFIYKQVKVGGRSIINKKLLVSTNRFGIRGIKTL